MPRYLACCASVGAGAGEPPFEDDDVDVEIGEGRILVTYFDERGPVVFVGVETATGVFALSARSRPRKAELTLREDRLEGRWWQGEESGTLRIELGEPES